MTGFLLFCESAQGLDLGVRLHNPRWDRGRAPAGSRVIASVEADLPESEWRTRVVFTWIEILPDGTRTVLGSAEGHILRGRAWAGFRIPAAAPDPDGGMTPGPGLKTVVPARLIVFHAKHSASEPVESAPLAVEGRDGPVFDGLLLYSPVRGAYLLAATREEAAPWLEEFARMRALRGRTRLAWEIPDAGFRLAALRRLAAEAKPLFGNCRVGSWSPSPLEELLVLADNRAWETEAWVHARTRILIRESARVQWRPPSDPLVQEILDGLASPPPGRKPCPWLDPNLGGLLLRHPPGCGRPWPWQWPQAASGPGGRGDKAAIRFGAQAAVSRFLIGLEAPPRSASAPALAAVDIRMRRLTGEWGQAFFDFRAGSLNGIWHWPDVRGLNLLDYLADTDLARPYLRSGRECRLRRTLSAGGAFLQGMPMAEALALPAWDATEQAEQAGSRSRSTVINQFLWSTEKSRDFEALSTLSLMTRAVAGRVPEAGMGPESVKRHTPGTGRGRVLRIAWEQGRFRLSLRRELAAALGCASGLEFRLGPAEGAALVGHLLQCVDFHHIPEVEKDAYQACKSG